MPLIIGIPVVLEFLFALISMETDEGENLQREIRAIHVTTMALRMLML